MQIHSRKMNTNKDVNFEELARCTDDFNGAQCKAVCIEAVCISYLLINKQKKKTRQNLIICLRV
jgi:ATP-dependent 26S proteasome regulatory subunit